jgi:hypothetical protein
MDVVVDQSGQQQQARGVELGSRPARHASDVDDFTGLQRDVRDADPELRPYARTTNHHVDHRAPHLKWNAAARQGVSVRCFRNSRRFRGCESTPRFEELTHSETHKESEAAPRSRGDRLHDRRIHRSFASFNAVHPCLSNGAATPVAE